MKTFKAFSTVICAAALALGTTVNAYSQTATTDSVGYVSTTIESGFNAIGLSMVKPPVFSGLVETENKAAGTLDLNTAPDLDQGTKYYLEVLEGDAVGERFDIASWDGTTVTLDLGASSFSTVSTLDDLLDGASALVSLDGTRIYIRSHYTIGDIAGIIGDNVQTGEDSSTADQILLFRNGFKFHYPWSGDNTWYQDYGDISVADDMVIAPGEGFFYFRNPNGSDAGSSFSFRVLGFVRPNAFVYDLKSGYQLISLGHPSGDSPMSLGFDVAGGFDGGEDSGASDLILTWDNGFKFHFMWDGDGRWYQDFGDISDVTEDNSLFSPSAAVIVKKSTQPTKVVVAAPGE